MSIATLKCHTHEVNVTAGYRLTPKVNGCLRSTVEVTLMERCSHKTVSKFDAEVKFNALLLEVSDGCFSSVLSGFTHLQTA